MLRNSYVEMSEEEKRHAGVDLDKFAEEQKKCMDFTSKRVRRSKKKFMINAQKLMDEAQSALVSDESPDKENNEFDNESNELLSDTNIVTGFRNVDTDNSDDPDWTM